MRESLFNYCSSHQQLVSPQDFTQAPVAIVREARQVPDAKNNLQKRFCHRLSVYGPNPNGVHTVAAKKACVQNTEPGHQPQNNGYIGLQINSASSLCRHYLDSELFQRTVGSLPLLLNFFERGCLLADLNQELFSKHDVKEVAPEFLLWACTGSGINSVRRCYEVLETYGDTVLKLAATLLAYSLK